MEPFGSQTGMPCQQWRGIFGSAALFGFHPPDDAFTELTMCQKRTGS